MYLGQPISGRLQPEVFRRWFLLGRLALGAYMVWHARTAAACLTRRLARSSVA